MTWTEPTGIDIRTLPPSEPSMVRCCYCRQVVAPTVRGEDRCACPPHRGVSYEGKRFVYGIRSYFVRVSLALAA